MACSQSCNPHLTLLQDDLAEHTMHSPVWQDYDPAIETAEVWSDWDYYSDDFYDEDSPRKRSKFSDAGNTVDEQGEEGSRLRRKRRKLHSTSKIPELYLGDSLYANSGDHQAVAPIVVWKSKTEPNNVPVVSEGQEEKVALLKDWRERFKIPSRTSPNLSKSQGVARRGSQKAVAVVIEQKASEKDTKRRGPTTTLLKDPGIPSRSRITQKHNNGTAMTASSAAKQRQKVWETPKHAAATKPTQKPSSKRTVSTLSEDKAPTSGLKRKASALTDDDDCSATFSGASKRLNSAKATKTTQANEPLKKGTLVESVASETLWKSGRPKAETSIPPVTSKGSTHSKKATNTKAAVLEPLPNGKVAGKGNSVTNAETSKEAQPEAPKGSLRKRKVEELQIRDAEPPAKRNTPPGPRGQPLSSLQGLRSKR